ncbi:type II toxin-antitoxin system VapC family toxin [Knoellia subterranea]|uniref:Ribonuclease VapC n=1 Tax=Knoellia subterranea KCTC 19937 TaxID=1385521 RepID=A0A0A0JFA9_9MICO|nr:type II toxin-antitoxin system VapC family toxin [Knoellia subterranea]KGN36080.1 hypothetical protein N803_09280 [Knoellia subterranea KCTC 19937]
MIVLDTNLVSEVLRSEPNPGVVDWLRGVPHPVRRLSAITVGELLQGVFVLPEGRRRDQVHAGVEGVLLTFSGKVLDVDARSAPYFAEIRARRRHTGRPIRTADAWIAAVCRRWDVPLATRNVKDFEGTGIAVINPWEPA